MNIHNYSPCIMINEASSSKTAFFSFTSRFDKNHIIDENGNKAHKYSLQGTKITDYVAIGNYSQYFHYVIKNDIILNHVASSNCTKFYWALLSTGGMRSFEEEYGEERVYYFYKNLSNLFIQNPYFCYGNICKEVILSRAETIDGEKEAMFAWLSLQKNYETDCHAVIDLGGETGQFANSTHKFSDNLGKERAASIIKNFEQSEHSEIAPLQYCSSRYNKEMNETSTYNGEICRNYIENYFSNNFVHRLPIVQDTNYCKIYGISNFYYFLNEICQSYHPELEDKITHDNYEIVTSVCKLKNESDQLSLTMNSFKNIADIACIHWNSDWKDPKAHFANDACFSGNYIYHLLKALGITKKEIYVSALDWAEGAAIYVLNQVKNLFNQTNANVSYPYVTKYKDVQFGLNEAYITSEGSYQNTSNLVYE